MNIWLCCCSPLCGLLFYKKTLPSFVYVILNVFIQLACSDFLSRASACAKLSAI